jgi:predicted XRE-type DNA-binding protein
MTGKEKIQRGSGNVFEDIGADHPERVRTRAQVMFRIAGIIRDRGLTQKEAAKLLGIPQPKVSCLMNGKLSMFSLDLLFEILNALDKDVEIVIHPKSRKEKSATTHVWLTTVFA